MKRSIATCLAAAAIVFAATPTPLLAQETGAVRGSVALEVNGDPIRGALILVVGSGAFALTDAQGSFQIDGLPAGEYEVVAQRDYLTASRQTVRVQPGGAATADFVLSLSPVQEEVTVTASAGGTETALEAFNAVSTLDVFDVARETTGDLATALPRLTGSFAGAMTPAERSVLHVTVPAAAAVA